LEWGICDSGWRLASETWRSNVVGHACILDASCDWSGSRSRGPTIRDGAFAGRQRRRGRIGMGLRAVDMSERLGSLSP
jgi:hypothetical protein